MGPLNPCDLGLSNPSRTQIAWVRQTQAQATNPGEPKLNPNRLGSSPGPGFVEPSARFLGTQALGSSNPSTGDEPRRTQLGSLEPRAWVRRTQRLVPWNPEPRFVRTHLLGFSNEPNDWVLRNLAAAARKVNVPPSHLRRMTIRSQVGRVHGGGRVRNPDFRFTQALKLGGQPIKLEG
ncbi:hypothetical protein SLEP1_g5733 [Rubroshorea leprosula]|uniref:Ribosomal protein L23 n=1 Tax=Rubroshorea leprosula TaxID=152421 RepID=A0AAV5HSW8_9ROSI|nr:hypothetical protein SLEP1_g5733 [Rubroshorea leprosula]